MTVPQPAEGSPPAAAPRPRALTATLWSAADALGRQAVQLVIAVVLARLLTPEDFGTVALLAVVLGLATVLADAGFSTALIQRRDITAHHETSAFVVVLGLGLVATGVLELVAGRVADFYGRPELVTLLRVLALNVVFSAAGSVPLALLTRRLAFRRVFVAGITSSTVSGVVAVAAALAGWGLWALAAQSLTLTLTATVLYWALARWWPRAGLRLTPTRELAAFGGFMLASGVLDVVFTRAYTVFLGRQYGAAEVGQYGRADSTQQIPATALSAIVGRVALPYFSSIAHEVAALRAGVRLALRGLMLMNVPMMLGLAALAEPVVQVLFGDQWGPAVPILRVLCLAGCLWPLHVVNLSALLAQGHARLMFRLEVVKKGLGIVLLAAGSLAGVLGVAWAMVLLAVLAAVINMYYTARMLQYGVVQQARDIGAVVAVSAAMGGSVSVLSRAWQAAPWLELVCLVPAGVLLFLAIARITHLTALDDAWQLLRRERTATDAGGSGT